MSLCKGRNDSSWTGRQVSLVWHCIEVLTRSTNGIVIVLGFPRSEAAFKELNESQLSQI
jgi:hypothetical protein